MTFYPRYALIVSSCGRGGGGGEPQLGRHGHRLRGKLGGEGQDLLHRVLADQACQLQVNLAE